MKAFDPLLEVGLSYLRDSYPDEGDEQSSKLREIMRQFIYGEIECDAASRIFEAVAGTSMPIHKLKTILDVGDQPIQPSRETYCTYNGNSTRRKIRPWTQSEDARLLAAIHRFGLDDWKNVSDFVGSGRTKSMCSQRWFRGLDPRISKVVWREDEEQKLASLVEKLGDRSWTRIALEIGSRSDAQCRYHWSKMKKSRGDLTPPCPTPQIQRVRSSPNAFFMSDPSDSPPSCATSVSGSKRHEKLPSIASFITSISQIPPLTQLCDQKLF